MTLRAALPLLLAGIWLAAPGAAHAREPVPAAVDDVGDDADTPVFNDAPWVLNASAQGTRHGAVGLTGELRYDLSRSTTLHGTGHGIDYQYENTSGALSPPRSLAADMGVLHHFGHLGLDVTVGHWIVVHAASANELNLASTLESGAYSGALRAGFRRSRFSQFTATTTADFGTGIQGADVTAACGVNNIVIGADGRWQGRAFGAHAEIKRYQYGDVSCNYSAAGLGSASVSENAAQFVALGGAPMSRLHKVALPIIGGQPSFADTFGQIGMSWRYKDVVLAADYLRQRDHFFGDTATAYFGTLTADLGGGAGVDVTLGRSLNNGAPGLFGGIGVRTRF